MIFDLSTSRFINYTYCIYLALLLGIVATVIICTKLTEPAPIKDADEGTVRLSYCRVRGGGGTIGTIMN